MELVEAWREVHEQPYLLPGDEALQATGRLHQYTTAAEFLEQNARESTYERDFHAGLVPVPYLGDLEKARAFILMLNPGFRPADYFIEEHDPTFRNALLANLHQEPGRDHPLVSMDPRFQHHGGHEYWSAHGRLGWLVDRLVHDGMTERGAIQRVAQRIAVLQYFPYRSRSFRLPDRIAARLRSTRLSTAFVRDELQPRLDANQATAIVTRKTKQWDLRGRNVINYAKGQARGASLGPKSPAATSLWDAVRDA